MVCLSIYRVLMWAVMLGSSLWEHWHMLMTLYCSHQPPQWCGNCFKFVSNMLRSIVQLSTLRNLGAWLQHPGITIIFIWVATFVILLLTATLIFLLIPSYTLDILLVQCQVIMKIYRTGDASYWINQSCTMTFGTLTTVSRQRRHTKTMWLYRPRRVIKVLLECMCLLSTSTYLSRFFFWPTFYFLESRKF